MKRKYILEPSRLGQDKRMGNKGHETLLHIQKERGRELHRVLSKDGKGDQNDLDKDEAAISI